MNITLPVWLVVCQWVLLLALGALIFVAYRQIGYMVHLKEIGSGQEGLAVGEQAPAFDSLPAFQQYEALTRFEPKGRWSLLLFADPGCMSCQNVLPVFERLVARESLPLRVFIVTSASPVQLEVSEAFRATSLEILRVSYDVPSKLYRTRVTPFAFTIDAEGRIRSKGIATDEPALRHILQSAERRNVIAVEPIASSKR